MSGAKDGDQVHIHYTGRLTDGTVFDSSRERDPLSFKLGEGQVIPGFEKLVRGMAVGEKRSETLAAEVCYGPRRDELTTTVGRTSFPDHIEPKVGQVLEVRTESGQPAQVVVAAIEGEEVRLDANHPLAGEDLTFEVELVAIGDAS